MSNRPNIRLAPKQPAERFKVAISELSPSEIILNIHDEQAGRLVLAILCRSREEAEDEAREWLWVQGQRRGE